MKTRHTKWIVAATAGVVAACLVTGIRSCWHHRYPYGASHICNKQVGLALGMYAADHNGRFPDGQATPEASFSLLHAYMRSPALLAGKGASVEKAASVLAQGGLLGPAECNWYYVEGLSTRDPPDLLILWDKIPGLGHNCERLPEGGHEVLFTDGHADFVREAEWPKFLGEQRKKMPSSARFPVR